MVEVPGCGAPKTSSARISPISAGRTTPPRLSAVLTVELERLEAPFAVAGEASAEALDTYARVAANLRRLLEAVGLKRRPRDVTPTLAEYLASLKQADTTTEKAE